MKERKADSQCLLPDEATVEVAGERRVDEPQARRAASVAYKSPELVRLVRR